MENRHQSGFGSSLGFRSARWIAALWFLCFAALGSAAELEDARKQFLAGQYTQCIESCTEALKEYSYQEEWRELLVRSHCALGQYEQAGLALSNALDRFSWSIGLRVLAHDVFRYTSQSNRSEQALRQIDSIVSSRSDFRFRDARSMIAVGQAALLLGADARRVLDNVFIQAQKAAPDQRAPYLAIGELALEKQDFALASKYFDEGLKKFPGDPEFHFGLARAFQPSDRRQMIAHLEQTLEANTNHTGAMLLLADHLIDGEGYESAEELLDRALAVNPWHPEAWAYRAVIAHLHNDPATEEEARAKALHWWNNNPQVDHLIGQSLSQKYRFVEGSSYQRRALAMDPDYIPAKAQLAQDLLRLGDEAEGWHLAEAAHEQDAYDVASFNLVSLKDKMARFQTLTNADFVLRMGTNEAPIYGEQALALLSRAKTVLTGRYGVTLEQPTTVEIFPEQKDFGVRTFGMPDNPGYLGVCFGPVITANSPASQAGHPANWEAVLWHEFAHVVTLQMTKNKMPRWLSEGISVFEELEANPAWGQRMNAQYREMILKDELTPVGELSSAFLAPKTPLHLQFAYYESALVVEFLVREFGFDAIRRILLDLGKGIEINQAIETHTAGLEKIEKDFEAFAKARAASLAPELDFTRPEATELRSSDWLEANPTNYWALQRRARNFLSEKNWEAAKAPLEELVRRYPDQTGEDSVYLLLALVHREMGETNAELAVLKKCASQDAEALDAFTRLMKLGAEAKDWPTVYENAVRHLAVNPLVPEPHRYLAEAAEALEHDAEAIRAWRVLLRLDPPDPALAHYRLARLLHKTGNKEAKRQVLQALEEAPRYREAHQLLRELQERESKVDPEVRTAQLPATR